MSDTHAALEDDLGKAAAAFARLETRNAAPEGDDAADDEVEEIEADGADAGDKESEGEAKAKPDDDEEAEGEVDPDKRPASETPPSLSDEEKAAFKALPPEAQAFLRKYAERREGDIARHLNTKSGELAETHRQLKAKGEEAVAVLGKRIESLDAIVAGVEAIVKEPDWVSLSRTLTPEQYQEQRATWEYVQSKLKAAKEEREKLNGEAQAKHRERQSQIVEFHKAELIKEFKDDKGIDKAWGGTIEPYLAKEGFSVAERGGMFDSRMWRVAYKAALYEKLQAEKKTVRKEAKPAPKLTKPGTTSEPGDRANARLGTAMARLKKTGTVADAAAAFSALKR